MKFFIDTADLSEIQEGLKLGIIDGVTTNPSLMAKLGIKGEKAINDHYAKIAEMVPGPVSAEVLSMSYEKMISEGQNLSSIASNIVVKIPMCLEGIKAIHFFKQKGVKTNCTLIFSAAQAIMAAKAGATMISPFVGRIDDSSWDGIQLIEQIAHIFSQYTWDTEILAASIRNPLHIVKCAEVGADIATCPLSAIQGLVNHPLTTIGIDKFLEDTKKFME
ncbi:MAG: fructose-6-phosphate aldolase [Chitinophagales bacterium]|jgi:transaldolase|nr:fructose-6-phosphate aldolase [Chitinophagales bacterium]